MTSIDRVGAAWDRASEEYLARRIAHVECVTYGSLSPDDRELDLIGSIAEKIVIDIGCGGGHNAVACALAGATVAAIDPSLTQLDHARKLADSHQADVQWYQGGFEQLSSLPQANLLLLIHVLSYVQTPEDLLAACCQQLTEDGELIVAIDHPIRHCFWEDDTEELAPIPLRRYDDITPIHWQFDAHSPMQTYPRTTAQWVTLAMNAGLHLIELLEPLTPIDICDELWPQDSSLSPLRAIPHTLIMRLRADKRNECTQ